MTDEERDAQRETDEVGAPGPSELVSRLQVIEEQPVGDRAGAFAQLHEELRAALEAGDGIRSDG